MATVIGEDPKSHENVSGVNDGPKINNSGRFEKPKVGMNKSSSSDERNNDRSPASGSVNWNPNALINELANMESFQHGRDIPSTILESAMGFIGVVIDSISFVRDLELSARLTSDLEKQRSLLNPGESKRFVVVMSQDLTYTITPMTDNNSGVILSPTQKWANVVLVRPIPIDPACSDKEQQEYNFWINSLSSEVLQLIERQRQSMGQKINSPKSPPSAPSAPEKPTPEPRTRTPGGRGRAYGGDC